MFAAGGEGKEDSVLKKHHSKWTSSSTQIDLATSKTQTDKMVFDKLRKDFNQFFNLDLYYASVCYASNEAFSRTDGAFSKSTSKVMPTLNKPISILAKD